MAPLALYNIKARLGFRAQTLGHTKIIVHENEDQSCKIWSENEAEILRK